MHPPPSGKIFLMRKGRPGTLKDEMIISNEGGMNICPFPLLRLKMGEIALFYSKKNSDEDNLP